LLIEQGNAVGGITMALPIGKEPEEEDGTVRDAKLVAGHLGMKHHAVAVGDIFKRNVIDYFVNEYRIGRTPNPCIQCNRTIKFGYLLKTAAELGYDFLATGHYARLQNGVLKKGIDAGKDQAYFLYVLYRTDMRRILFPNGSYTKEEIRDYARKLSLPVAGRDESQDICFIPEGDYATFLSGFIPLRKGNVVDVHGNVLGAHSGIHHYTVGQRKGVGAYGRRMFVKEIRPGENTVVIATDEELQRTRVEVSNCIVGPFKISSANKYQVRIRYRTAPVECVVREYEGSRMVIEPLRPVRGVAPGQAAVLYDGDRVIGGGTIDKGQ
jgi:tRNA-specific 2-thiouridylase